VCLKFIITSRIYTHHHQPINIPTATSSVPQGTELPYGLPTRSTDRNPPRGGEFIMLQFYHRSIRLKFIETILNRRLLFGNLSIEIDCLEITMHIALLIKEGCNAK
jgi:hypothetical protein